MKRRLSGLTRSHGSKKGPSCSVRGSRWRHDGGTTRMQLTPKSASVGGERAERSDIIGFARRRSASATAAEVSL